jgi:glycosyltransferase involved in cell wall biosynthesis
MLKKLPQNKFKIIWLAVQPTSYNYYLYSALKKSATFDFKLVYSQKINNQLPFVETYFDDDDYFLNESCFIDFSLMNQILNKHYFFVFAGWDNKTKLFGILVRSLLGFPFAVWTDSVNTNKYKNRCTFSYQVKKYITRKATFIFTTGNFGVNKYLETGLTKNPNKLVSLPFFVPRPEKVKEVFKRDSFNIIQLCRLIDSKGIHISIKAFAELKKIHIKNIKLYVAGVGPQKAFLEKLIQQYDLEDQVFLMGWQDKNGLEKLMHNADLLIHPVIDHDPFPLVVLEALTLGLPVIGSDLAGSVVERVKDGFNGFIIKANSISMLMDKILALYNDRNLLAVMSNNARISADEWPVSKGIKIVEQTLSQKLLFI